MIGEIMQIFSYLDGKNEWGYNGLRKCDEGIIPAGMVLFHAASSGDKFLFQVGNPCNLFTESSIDVLPGSIVGGVFAYDWVPVGNCRFPTMSEFNYYENSISV